MNTFVIGYIIDIVIFMYIDFTLCLSIFLILFNYPIQLFKEY